MRYLLALKVQYPSAIEKAYERALVSLVNEIYRVLFENIFNQNSFAEGYTKVLRTDDFNDDFQKLISFSELAIALKLKNFVKKIIEAGEKLNRFNQKAVAESLKNIFCKQLGTGSMSIYGIGRLPPDFADKRALWVSENVSLIKSIGQTSLKEVEQIVYSAIRRGAAHTELVKELTKRFTISKKRARLIARDQINKLNADLIRARHLDLGITLYKWSTCRDERVRKPHEVLEGKICNYNDVDIYKNSIEEKKWLERIGINATLSQPGQDVLCRCTSVAIIPF